MLLAFSTIFSWLIKKRVHQIELFMKFPLEVQRDVLDQLINFAVHTKFGAQHGLDKVSSIKEFQKAVPLQDYDDIKSDVSRMMDGEEDVLWPGETRWFAKSSGTTLYRR